MAEIGFDPTAAIRNPSLAEPKAGKGFRKGQTHSPESRAKAQETMRRNKLRRKAAEGILDNLVEINHDILTEYRAMSPALKVVVWQTCLKYGLPLPEPDRQPETKSAAQTVAEFLSEPETA